MKKLFVVFGVLLFVFIACKNGNSLNIQTQPGDEIVGKWYIAEIDGIYGSNPKGKLTYTFKKDRTFVSVEEYKGKPNVEESGKWNVIADTLIINYLEHKSPAKEGTPIVKYSTNKVDTVKYSKNMFARTIKNKYKVENNILRFLTQDKGKVYSKDFLKD